VERAAVGGSFEDDGLAFLGERIRAQEFREQQVYGGIRIRLTEMLGTARIPVQIDVGFGDAIVPGTNPQLFQRYWTSLP